MVSSCVVVSFLDKARDRASAVVNQQNLANVQAAQDKPGLMGWGASTKTILSEILLGAGVSMPGRQLHAVCKFCTKRPKLNERAYINRGDGMWFLNESLARCKRVGTVIHRVVGS